MANVQPDWHICIIGGSSGTGKTVVGQELARRFGVSLLLVDDVRLAIQAVTTPEQNPSIHTFVAEGSRAMSSPESVCEGLIAVARAMEPALRIIMAHHLVVPGVRAVIIEGDGILPQFVSAKYLSSLDEFRNVPVEEAVRTVFLYERERDAIFDNMLSRGRGFRSIAPERQRALSEGSWQFGQYIVRQAQASGQSVVLTRPFDTLVERVLASLGGTVM